MQIKIPWAGPHLWGNEEKYVLDALQSTWISGGPYVDRFETDFAEYNNVSHAISVSNGTTALHLALWALNIGVGDEVVIPGFGFLAAANIALHIGAKPVFSEVNSDSWCMTAEDAEACITPKTRAIVAIHTYGNMCDMDPLVELARSRNIDLIEDAAEAIGSKYKGQMAGTIAQMGVFSFHATKTITTGEGGAVVTKDQTQFDRMRLMRSHGMATKRYWHEVAGHNFRLTNLQAAIGCAQLEQIERIIIERDRVYRTYKQTLEKIEGVTLQKFSSDIDPVVWAIAVKLDSDIFPQGRDRVIEQFLSYGVETRPGFYAASSMPHLYGQTNLPLCEMLSRNIISLPSNPMLTEDEIFYICACLSKLKK